MWILLWHDLFLLFRIFCVLIKYILTDVVYQVSADVFETKNEAVDTTAGFKSHRNGGCNIW
jgi:hypothetical protein